MELTYSSDAIRNYVKRNFAKHGANKLIFFVNCDFINDGVPFSLYLVNWYGWRHLVASYDHFRS